MRKAIEAQAATFFREIVRNVDDFYSDRISNTEFDRRQKVTWRNVEAAGVDVHKEVLRLWRVWDATVRSVEAAGKPALA